VSLPFAGIFESIPKGYERKVLTGLGERLLRNDPTMLLEAYWDDGQEPHLMQSRNLVSSVLNARAISAVDFASRCSNSFSFGHSG
jgi:hypothetical protein